MCVILYFGCLRHEFWVRVRNGPGLDCACLYRFVYANTIFIGSVSSTSASLRCHAVNLERGQVKRASRLLLPSLFFLKPDSSTIMQSCASFNMYLQARINKYVVVLLFGSRTTCIRFVLQLAKGSYLSTILSFRILRFMLPEFLH